MIKKNKTTYMIFIMIVIISISVGYALINRNLIINGNSSVSQNTWDIHFENVSVTAGSVVAEKTPTIENSNLSVDFNVILNLPGDFYEFTVEVHNDGTIDAMVDSILNTSELTAEQEKYVKFLVEYESGASIKSKQLLKIGESVKIKVRVAYRNDILEEDLPTIYDTLSLGFTLNYIQADDETVVVDNNGFFKIAVDGSLDDIGSIVTIGTEQFYTIGTEGDNVKLLSMYNLYVGGYFNWDDGLKYYGDEATGMQDSTMRAYVVDEDMRYGTVGFSNATFKGDSYYTYNGSLLEHYVNNYKKLFEEKFKVDIKEARVISVDELTSEAIGCNLEEKNCNAAPKFIYSTSYWTGTTLLDKEYIYGLSNAGDIGFYKYHFNYSLGVRPVIILPKSLFQDFI